MLCQGAGGIETDVGDSEGLPMVDVEVLEGRMRGGEERVERVLLMAAETQDSNEREEIVSTKM